MALFNRVTIIGVGLIGGSLGLEIKKKGLAKEVLGVGRSRHNLQTALKRRLIDKTLHDLPSALQNSDLILLCSPVSTIQKQLLLVASHAKPGALVMDVGSTKGDIVKEAMRVIPPAVHFIGAHPIAGTEKGGAKGAEADLFYGKKCLLTPTSSCPKGAREKAKKFWERLGMVVLTVTPREHDKIMSVVSHLPQILSYSLLHTARQMTSTKKIKNFSGSGFRDMTRLASSPPEIWGDIALSNAPFIKRALDVQIKELSKIRHWIDLRNKKALLSTFKRVANIKKYL